MTAPLMPKATALWLIENTTLTFEQIAQFCHLHALEVQTIADGDANTPVVPFDPIANQQLTPAEIKRCEADTNATLSLMKPKVHVPERKAGRRYTPVSKRSERPDAIAWVLKHHPQLSMKQVMKLLGTTAKTVEAIKNRTHRNSQTIKPRCPVVLGICKQSDLDQALAIANAEKDQTMDTATE